MTAFTEEELLRGDVSIEALKAKFEELSMEELPGPIKRRVVALKRLADQHRVVETEYEKEVLALERKYEGLYKPLYEKRATIVKGEYEPTDSETNVEVGKDELAQVKGVPGFWLTAMNNNHVLRDQITDADKEALQYLADVRVTYPEEDGHTFSLEFEFAPNPFFENKIITKTYVFSMDEGSYGPAQMEYDHSEVATPILWKSGKDLTVRAVTKTQRHKSSGATRTVTVEEPNFSWFQFFTPPKYDDIEDEEDMETVQAEIAEDYENGEIFKEKIIPEAVNWYLGLLMEEDDPELEAEHDHSCGSCDEHDHDHDDDEDEDEEEEDHPSGPVKPNAEQCKQQ